MPIAVKCQCGQKFTAKDELGGKTVKCPKCGNPLKIPAPAPAVPAPPAPTPAAELDMGLGAAPAAESWVDDLLGSQPVPTTSHVAAPQSTHDPLAAASAAAAPAAATAKKKTGKKKGKKKGKEADSKQKMLYAWAGVGAAVVIGIVAYFNLRSGNEPPQAAAIDPQVAAAFEDSAPAATTAGGTAATTTPDAEAKQQAKTGGRSATPAAIKGALAPVSDAAVSEIIASLKVPVKAGPPKLDVDMQTLDAIKKAFRRLNAAFEHNSPDEFQRIFDMTRMLAEAERHGAIDLKILPAAERPRLVGEFKQNLAYTIVQQSSLMRWSSSEIRQVQLSKDGKEAVVLIRLQLAHADVTSKERFWLSRRGGRWQFYDFEDLRSGGPLSKSIMLAYGGPEDVERIQLIRNAMQQLNSALAQDNPDSLLHSLNQLDQLERHLTPGIDAVRHYLRGMYFLATSEYGQALERFDAAARVGGDAPALMLGRAQAHTRLDSPKVAIAYVREYEKRLGRDDDSWHQLGLALAALDRAEESLTAYRRGLEYNPKSADCWYELATSLPSGRRDELLMLLHDDKVGLQTLHRLAGQLQRNSEEELFQIVLKTIENVEQTPQDKPVAVFAADETADDGDEESDDQAYDELTADESDDEGEMAADEAADGETVDEATEEDAAETSAADGTDATEADEKPKAKSGKKPMKEEEFDPFSEDEPKPVPTEAKPKSKAGKKTAADDSENDADSDADDATKSKTEKSKAAKSKTTKPKAGGSKPADDKSKKPADKKSTDKQPADKKPTKEEEFDPFSE